MTSLSIDQPDDPFSRSNLPSSIKEVPPDKVSGIEDNGQATEKKVAENKRGKAQKAARTSQIGKTKTEKRKSKEKIFKNKKNANKKDRARGIGFQAALARRGPQTALKKRASSGKNDNFGNHMKANANFVMMMSSNIQCGFLAVNSLIDACKKL